MRQRECSPWLKVSLLMLVLKLGVCLGEEVVEIPLDPNYESVGGGESWPPQLFGGGRSGKAMYLSQGVEFVFPIGVQYTLANVNEQLWPIGTTGFDTVLEFPKSKIAIMFSSMINTLKIANFSISSSVYTADSIHPTTALRILGTDLKPTDFTTSYKDSWTNLNKDIGKETNGAISEFVPKGSLYGRSIYPFTKAAYVNTVYYENNWAFPWRLSNSDRFSDSPSVSYLEVEGLMPYYENEAFIAIAALFKSGTGSVVFLKPKGNITILQLMLNPTALTQIFDENFPGWGVKQMRVRIPEASFTTNSQHYDMLVKRGVSETFCVHELAKRGESSEGTRNFLNPIVQTNHLKITKDSFQIASVTGVTLNNEKDISQWNNRLRDSAQEVPPETLLEEYTTPKTDGEEDGATSQDGIVEDEVTTVTPDESADDADSSIGRKDLPSLTLKNASGESVTGNGEIPAAKVEKKPAETFSSPSELYEFNEPFLWFLHAINEEPMFMGVIESFKRYLEETGNKENNNIGGSSSSNKVAGVIDKNAWIYEAARGILWHCPSQINKQAE